MMPFCKPWIWPNEVSRAALAPRGTRRVSTRGANATPLAGQRSVRNIPSKKCSLIMNSLDGIVGAFLSLCQRVAKRRHAENTSPVRHNKVVFQGSPGVKNFDVRQFGGLIKSRYNPSFNIVSGIALACHDHADGRPRIPFEPLGWELIESI